MPALFVLLWSTGFIGARLGMPHAEPMTFLALRFALTAALLGRGSPALAGAMAAPAGRLGPSRRGRAPDARRLSGRRVRRDPARARGRAIRPDRRPAAAAGGRGGAAGPGRARQRRAPGSGWAWASRASPWSWPASWGWAAAMRWRALACLAALAGITVGTLYQKRFCGAPGSAHRQLDPVRRRRRRLLAAGAPVRDPAHRLDAASWCSPSSGWSSCSRWVRSACSTYCSGGVPRRR